MRTCERFVVDDHANDGHGNGSVRSGLAFFSCVEFKDLHCADPEYARDGKLATSGQVELPDLKFGQSSALALVSILLYFRDWEKNG